MPLLEYDSKRSSPRISYWLSTLSARGSGAHEVFPGLVGQTHGISVLTRSAATLLMRPVELRPSAVSHPMGLNSNGGSGLVEFYTPWSMKTQGA